MRIADSTLRSSRSVYGVSLFGNVRAISHSDDRRWQSADYHRLTMTASRLARKQPAQKALISVVASTIWYRRWGSEWPFRCAARPGQEADRASGQRGQAE